MKGGGGRGSGKGLNSRYGGHWKLEKVFFNESVSTILQLVVARVRVVEKWRAKTLVLRTIIVAQLPDVRMGRKSDQQNGTA